MSTTMESLRHLKQEVSAVNALIRHVNKPGNCLAPAMEELLTTSAEVLAFVDEEWRKTILSCNENRRAFIQEQSSRLHQAITLFHLRCGMSTYELVSEIERKIKVTEVRVRDEEIFTGDSLGPGGASFAMTKQPMANNFHVYQGGVVNYHVSNVNEHTTNTNSGHSTSNTTIASSNNF